MQDRRPGGRLTLTRNGPCPLTEVKERGLHVSPYGVGTNTRVSRGFAAAYQLLIAWPVACRSVEAPAFPLSPMVLSAGLDPDRTVWGSADQGACRARRIGRARLT